VFQSSNKENVGGGLAKKREAAGAESEVREGKRKDVIRAEERGEGRRRRVKGTKGRRRKREGGRGRGRG
jgi:hypothetical protein